MGSTLWAALNRPAGPLASSLRIDEPVPAYLLSGIIGTAITCGVGGLVRFVSAGGVRQLQEADITIYFGQAFSIWLFFTAAVLFVGAPFVPLATWIGARLRVESVAYYGLTGGLVMAALVYAALGPPRPLGPHEFGFMSGLWPFGPLCAAIFGVAWWYLNRRWKSEPGQAPK
jgi:hypothetical protein